MQLKFYSRFNHDHLSVAGQDAVFALDDEGIDVLPILNGLGAGQDVYRFNRMKKLANKEEKGDFIHICLEMPEAAPLESLARFNILWTDCDTHYVPQKWVEKCRMFDALFVPSFFCKNSFQESGFDKPIFVIPYPFDKKRFTGKNFPNREKFKFLYFDSWKKANGYEELLNAYFTEFRGKDDVELHIMSSGTPENIEKSVVNVAGKTSFPLNILKYVEWNCDLLTNDFIPEFFSRYDCLVSPHYGKSFGLSIVQAMSLGMPVITTDFGGVQDHCRNNTCYLVKSKQEKAVNNLEGAWYKKNMVWGRPQEEDLRRCMRSAYERVNADLKIESAKELVNRRYSYQQTCRKIKDALNTMMTGIWDDLNV